MDSKLNSMLPGSKTSRQASNPNDSNNIQITNDQELDSSELQLGNPHFLKGHLLMLAARTDEGDHRSKIELLQLLAQHPDQIPNLGGDLSHNVRELLAARASCGKPATQAAVLVWQDHLRAQLAAPGDSPLEQMLLDRLLNVMLQIDTLDLRAAKKLTRPNGKLSVLAAAQERAHRRFLATVRSLAALRKNNMPWQLELSLAAQDRARKEAENEVPRVEAK